MTGQSCGAMPLELLPKLKSGWDQMPQGLKRLIAVVFLAPVYPRNDNVVGVKYTARWHPRRVGSPESATKFWYCSRFKSHDQLKFFNNHQMVIPFHRPGTSVIMEMVLYKPVLIPYLNNNRLPSYTQFFVPPLNKG